MWIFIALVAVPILEIALFIEVGGAIGLWPTLAIVIATALAGTILLRSQGIAAMSGLQRDIEAGRDPSKAIAHGALIVVAGVVLLTPGFFTDAIGLALLIPPVRAAVIKAMAKRLVVMQMRRAEAQKQARPAGQQTVDADFEDVTEDEREAPRRPDPRPGPERDDSPWRG